MAIASSLLVLPQSGYALPVLVLLKAYLHPNCAGPSQEFAHGIMDVWPGTAKEQQSGLALTNLRSLIGLTRPQPAQKQSGKAWPARNQHGTSPISGKNVLSRLSEPFHTTPTWARDLASGRSTELL